MLFDLYILLVVLKVMMDYVIVYYGNVFFKIQGGYFFFVMNIVVSWINIKMYDLIGKLLFKVDIGFNVNG